MAGFLYLAVVLDAWSRKIVGWAMANHLRARRGSADRHYGLSGGSLRHACSSLT
jgi:transposase InsO family protein